MMTYWSDEVGVGSVLDKQADHIRLVRTHGKLKGCPSVLCRFVLEARLQGSVGVDTVKVLHNRQKKAANNDNRDDEMQPRSAHASQRPPALVATYPIRVIKRDSELYQQAHRVTLAATSCP